jgi:hypothetical protein
MDNLLKVLIDNIQKQRTLREDEYWMHEIPERCIPVLWFGNHKQKKMIATLGANPSRNEFFKSRTAAEKGDYLPFDLARFYTFTPKDLMKPDSPETIQKIIQSYDQYFKTAPYTRWFGKPNLEAYNVEGFLNGYGASFYREGLGCIHLDLIPFATIKDFKSLDKTKLESSFFKNGWANQNLNRLIKLLNLQRVFIFGRTNVDWFNRYYSSLQMNEEYKSGSVKSEFGHSTIKVNGLSIPVTGISTNFGNPRGFDKKTIFDFGAFFKSDGEI